MSALQSHLLAGGPDSPGDRLVVSVSGGKDSTAVCLWLMEQGLGPDDYDRVFCDTGWELPSVYEYLRGPLTEKVGLITELRPAIRPLKDPRAEEAARWLEGQLGLDYSGMVRLVLSRGMMPSRKIRICTQELKAFTSAAYLKAMEDEPINLVGIRAEESHRRAQMPEWEWSSGHDCWVWRPIIRWTFEDVVAIHQRHNMAPAPPYFSGASRVGCAPCIMARKSELAWLAKEHPERIAILAAMERAVGWLSAERHAAKGPDGGKWNQPTWFHDPNPPRDPKTRKVLVNHPEYQSMWPIERIVEWAAPSPTSQMSFADLGEDAFAGKPEDHGCMRWGFCDTGGRR